MRIEENKKEIQKTQTLSEKLETERNEYFKNNGIDEKIDKDIQNKRTFASLAFQQPYAGVIISEDRKINDEKTLRILEKSLKKHLDDGLLSETDFIMDNIFERIVSGFNLSPANTEPLAKTYTDFLLATHGFVYLNQSPEKSFNSSFLSGNEDKNLTPNLPSQITEIKKHIQEKYAIATAQSTGITTSQNPHLADSKIDLKFCKEKIDELEKELNLSDREKSAYLANIISADQFINFIKNIPEFNNILTSDFDKYIFDLTLSYRIVNETNQTFQHTTFKDQMKKYFQNYNLKEQEDAMKTLDSLNLKVTLNALSEMFSSKVVSNYNLNHSIHPEDLIGEESYVHSSPVINSLTHFRQNQLNNSQCFKNIKEDFKKEENITNPSSAKDNLLDFINLNIDNTVLKADEKYNIIGFFARPYGAKDKDEIDMTGAYANLFPEVTHFKRNDIVNQDNSEYFNTEADFDEWLLNFSDARLKYGASILETGAMKRFINN